MTIEEVRHRMETWWTEVDAEAMAQKDSQSATLALITLYQTFDAGERSFVDQVLAEWLASTEERKRFDALAVIDKFRIRSAAPQLRLLAAALRKETDRSAPFELKRVRSILATLGDST